MKSKRNIVIALGKRLQKNRTEIQTIMLRSQVFTGDSANEANLNLATSLNWIDAALIQFGRIEREP